MTKSRRRRLIHRHIVRREASQNKIERENPENGKATTITPRAEESIQIVNKNIDRDNYTVFDGPLDPDSSYSGFVEVIGMFSISFPLFFILNLNINV